MNRAVKTLPSDKEGNVTAKGSGDGDPVRAAALHCAFEELLDQVHSCEQEWRLMDRIDLSIRLREQRRDGANDGPA